MKIALAMIVKHTEPLEFLVRCINSVAPHIDGIFLTINAPSDKETKEAKELKKQLEVAALTNKYPPIHFSYTKWEQDFAKARNFNFSQVTKDFEWILWLDSDDILRGGDKMREAISRAEKANAQAVFFNYLYKVELTPDMHIRSVLIEHLRERLIRNIDVYHWVAPIHETCVPKVTVNQTDSDLCDVVHLSTDERAVDAIQRNIKILEDQLESQGNQKDPRTMYYLAKSYFDLNTEDYDNKAEALIMGYLSGSDTNTPSGWPEERAQAWDYLSEIYRRHNKLNMAIKATANSLIECAKFPQFYISMALHYLFKRDWETAKLWVQLAQHMPYPKTTLVLNPRDMQGRTLEVLFNVAVNTSDIEGAYAAAVKLKELYPNDQLMDDRLKDMSELKAKNDVAHNVINLGNYLINKGQIDKASSLVGAIPNEIEDAPMLVQMRQDLMPSRTWGDNEIAILCGRGFEKWSPKNIEKGIGGSEEAVIYLSKELTKLGWKVTVFADPQEDKGNYDGVSYLPYYYFNLRDTFNILIGWRNVGFFDTKVKAKKMYLWLHDIQNAAEYTDARVEKLDKIIPLSKWHRDNVPQVPDEKFMISGNGINLEHFDTLDKENIKRNPHRVIYTSSYDRGLEHLLNMWGDVKKEVPDAELHVFYGWNLFETFYANNPERMAWKAKIDKLMEQGGVTHHGRVGQIDVLRETYKSGIWAYPTHFGEISCITAMKCQAAGAIPVVCDYAALKETVQFGVKINVDKDDIYTPEIKEEYKQALIKALKDEKWQETVRPEMVKWARDKFDWSNVAKQWGAEFSETDRLTQAMNVILEKRPDLEKYMPVGLQEKHGKKQTY